MQLFSYNSQADSSLSLYPGGRLACQSFEMMKFVREKFLEVCSFVTALLLATVDRTVTGLDVLPFIEYEIVG
jgi:hypothetical protein